MIPFVDSESFPIISSHFSQVIGVIPAGIPSSNEFHFRSGMLYKFDVYAKNLTLLFIKNLLLVIIKKNSMCPMIILKSADIDSTIDCIINSTKYNEVRIIILLTL